MTRMNAALRRGSILLTGALLLGMIQAGPALATPVVPDAPAELAPIIRSHGNDMVNGYDDDATDLLRAEQQNAGDDALLAASAPSDHKVNVAVVQPSGTSSGTDFITDTAITDLLAKVGASWKTQSNNQVQSVRRDGAVQRYDSAYTCDQPTSAWAEAAARFGHADRYFYSSTASVHLLLLVPAACPASGLGSVGVDGVSVSANYGGVMWVSLKGGGDVETVTHEFGHNLGLNHSNSHQCPTATMSEGLADTSSNTGFSDGCVDYSYGDYYDVMGITWSGGNLRPTALNVTHKVRLGAISAGEMATVSLPAGRATAVQSFTLASVGQSTGLRDIAVTDPRTGRLYYVDFRGGGGADAGSLYETGQLASYGAAIGVRVLTLRASGASIVLNSPKKSPSTGSKLYLLAGETLSTRSGGVTVSVASVANATATVSVTVAGNPTSTPTPTPVPTVKPTAPKVPTVVRLSGTDRYATAIKVSQSGYPTTAPIVYVATGANYPDALAAAPAAASKGGPLLLTDSVTLPDSVKTEIKRLKPARIVIVGGENAVSRAVFTALKPLATRVDRLSGATRYETARNIVKDAFGTATEAYLATALNYPDALSAAAAAGARKIPVLLVDGTAAQVDLSTQALISSLKIKKVTIAGGTAVVSPGIESTLKRTGLTVARQGGSDRFETSRLINRAAFSTAAEMFVATGYQFPDALAGAVLAGTRKAPLYVVPATCMTAGALDDVTRLGVAKITLIGGLNALSPAVSSLRKC